MHLRIRTLPLCIAFLAIVLVFSQEDGYVYTGGSSDGGSIDASVAVHHSKHKDLFPLDWNDYVGTFLVAIGLLIAASGGVGGGGILVPLYILVYGFKPKYAIALSNFTILGSSFMNMAMNFPKRHPSKDRPLVDWDLVTIMLPLTMAGTLLGAFIGLFLPDAIVMILLILLLGYTTFGTLEKGFSQYKKETKLHAEKSNAELMQEVIESHVKAEEVAEKSGLLAKDDEEDGLEEGLTQTDSDDKILSTVLTSELDPRLQTIIDSEKNSPLFKVGALTVLFLGIMLLNIFRGGKGGYGSPVGIECGSTSYWMVTALTFIWIGLVFMYLRNILTEEWKEKKSLRYRYDEGDIEWTAYNTLYYPALCTLAGVFAGMFGIGGGIVMGPIMLQMGVHPLVVSATSAIMILYTAFTGTLSFAAFGLITWDYAWFLFVVGLIATAIGQFGVSYLVEKYKRTSYITLSIGAVVAISTVLLTLESLISSASAEAVESTSLCQ